MGLITVHSTTSYECTLFETLSTDDTRLAFFRVRQMVYLCESCHFLAMCNNRKVPDWLFLRGELQ